MIQSIIPIILAVHLLICLLLIGAILVQRSEGGGALGMGGGPTSMMSGRSATNFVTRTTTVLAGAFFVTSLTLTVLGSQTSRAPTSVMEDGSTTRDGLPTKSIDLSVPKESTNEVVPPASGIPASSATAPQPPVFPATPAEPAPAPTEPAKN
jgi:preprotein translocase subunit SecG